MTSQTLKRTGLIFALFGAAYAAEAQGNGGQRMSREDIIAKYDVDGDGQLSDTEKATMQKEMGTRTGRNGGQRNEQRMSREDMIIKFDVDGDGQLSDSEKETMRSEMGGQRGQQQRAPRTEQVDTTVLITKYDTDGSGELSATELTVFLADQNNNQPEAGPRNRGEGQTGQKGQADQKQNQNQRMSREEIIVKYDTDSDGKLSDTERAAMREDMRKSRAAE
jgi:Ca2+-binding EF-hand superfamily protein